MALTKIPPKKQFVNCSVTINVNIYKHYNKTSGNYNLASDVYR